MSLASQKRACDHRPCNNRHGSDRSIDHHNPAHRTLNFHSQNRNNRQRRCGNKNRKRQTSFANRQSLLKTVTMTGLKTLNCLFTLTVLPNMLSADDGRTKTFDIKELRLQRVPPQQLQGFSLPFQPIRRSQLGWPWSVCRDRWSRKD